MLCSLRSHTHFCSAKPDEKLSLVLPVRYAHNGSFCFAEPDKTQSTAFYSSALRVFCYIHTLDRSLGSRGCAGYEARQAENVESYRAYGETFPCSCNDVDGIYPANRKPNTHLAVGTLATFVWMPHIKWHSQSKYTATIYHRNSRC